MTCTCCMGHTQLSESSVREGDVDKIFCNIHWVKKSFSQ